MKQTEDLNEALPKLAQTMIAAGVSEVELDGLRVRIPDELVADTHRNRARQSAMEAAGIENSTDEDILMNGPTAGLPSSMTGGAKNG